MRQAFITGATGFIGGRLAEVICGLGIPVVGLVREWSRAARLSRLPVHMLSGDILNPDSLKYAMKGCDVVFHCAVDNRLGGKAHRRASVQGTTNVMQTALEMGVNRVVHLSSTAIYSYKPGPDAATEEGDYRYSGDAYCDGKIDAEKAALGYFREYGLPVTVLRPTIVYGPFGHHSSHTAAIIREGRMVLVNGGKGICNSLYVDNLVQAMLLAARLEEAAGEVFHISDTRPISWKEFIEGHALVLEESYIPFPEMTAQEIEQAREQKTGTNLVSSSWEQLKKLAQDPQMRMALTSVPILERGVQMSRSLARGVLPESTRRRLRQKLISENTSGSPESIAPTESHRMLYPFEVSMFTTFDEVTFKIDKARRVLGYDPGIDFEEGMRRTAAWMKWARL